MTALSAWNAQTTYVVGVTKNGFSTCRSCECRIGANELRLGVIYSHRNGYILLNWHHLGCFGKVNQDMSPDELEGFENLTIDQQQQVQRYLFPHRRIPSATAASSAKPPKHPNMSTAVQASVRAR